AQARRDATEPMVVTELLGKGFGLAQQGEDFRIVGKRRHCITEIEPEIDPTLSRGARRRKMREGLQRLPEVSNRFAEGRASGRLGSSFAEIEHSPVPDVALAIVTAERRVMRLEMPHIHGLDSARDPLMQQPSARYEDIVGGDLAHAIM